MERKADQNQSSKTMRSMGISKAQKSVMRTGSLQHLPNNIDTKKHIVVYGSAAPTEFPHCLI